MKRIMKTLKILVDFLEIHFNAFIFITLFLSMVMQVFMRYVLNMPSPLLHEITMYSFVWTVYLSSAFARRYRSHIRFNIIYDILPRKVQLILDLIFDLFVSILFGISFIPVVKMLISYSFIESHILKISWTYLFTVFPIFMILILIHNARFIWWELLELIKGRTPPKEEKEWD